MKKAGFTLLEVMVAVAILGVALTAIFSSEAGAIRASNRARRTNVATLLARCKLAELEEKVARDGFNESDEHDTDGCCEDAEVEGFTCEWILNRVVLPDVQESGSADPAAMANATGSGSGNAAGSAGTDPLSALTSGANGAAPTAESIMAGGATDMLSTIAMQLTYPILKPAIEMQVRRASVTVSWREGSGSRSFEVTQFLVGDAASVPGMQDGVVNPTGNPPPPPPPAR
jgi:general secretion pathway protein I